MHAIPVSLPVPVPVNLFNPGDVAFALAWAENLPVHRWAVFLDAADDGAEYLTVEACSGLNVVGYHVLPLETGAGVSATLDPWNGRSPPTYPSLRTFLMSLFPLSDEALAEAEAEAALFCKWHSPAAPV